MADKRISYKVNGRVQGVCFRDFTQRQAQKLGVTGYVSNASDGTVKGEAQASETVLDEFVQHLNKGPRHAKVTGVEQSDIDTKEGEKGFKVTY